MKKKLALLLIFVLLLTNSGITALADSVLIMPADLEIIEEEAAAEAVEEAASEVLEEALLAAVEPEADSDKSTKNTISVSDYEAVVP